MSYQFVAKFHWGKWRERKSMLQCYICKRQTQLYSFTDNERFLIGKYASVYGPTKAVQKFRKTHPHLKFGKNAARIFHAKYESVLKDLPESSTDVVQSKKKAGRPLLLGNEIDKKEQE